MESASEIPPAKMRDQRTNIVNFFGFSTSLLIESLSGSLSNDGIVCVFVWIYVVIRLADQIVMLFGRHLELCCQNLLASLSPGSR